MLLRNVLKRIAVFSESG